MGGPDDGFSIEPDELKGLCRDLRKAHSSLGRVKSGPGTEESSNIQFRRSLYFTKDLQPGEIIKESDIKSVRPGFGLPRNALVKSWALLSPSRLSATRPLGGSISHVRCYRLRLGELRIRL